MCQDAKDAGTTDMPISALRALGLEHPDYYEPYIHAPSLLDYCDVEARPIPKEQTR